MKFPDTTNNCLYLPMILSIPIMPFEKYNTIISFKNKIFTRQFWLTCEIVTVIYDLNCVAVFHIDRNRYDSRQYDNSMLKSSQAVFIHLSYADMEGFFFFTYTMYLGAADNNQHN